MTAGGAGDDSNTGELKTLEQLHSVTAYLAQTANPQPPVATAALF